MTYILNIDHLILRLFLIFVLLINPDFSSLCTCHSGLDNGLYLLCLKYEVFPQRVMWYGWGQLIPMIRIKELLDFDLRANQATPTCPNLFSYTSSKGNGKLPI